MPTTDRSVADSLRNLRNQLDDTTASLMSERSAYLQGVSFDQLFNDRRTIDTMDAYDKALRAVIDARDNLSDGITAAEEASGVLQPRGRYAR